MFAVASAAAGLSSRRFACDRCRGQKLRCLRAGPEQERCNRCAKADAICLTTPTLNNHNHVPDGHDANLVSRKRPRRLPASHIPVAFAADSGPSSSINVLQQSYSSDVSAQNRQAEDSSMFNTAFLEGLEDILHSPEPIPMLASTCDFNANQSYPFFNGERPLDCPGGSSTRITPDFSKASHKMPSTKMDETISVTQGALVDNQGKTTCVQATPAPDDFFAKLSHLNLDMAGQLGRLSHGPPTVNIDHLISPADETNPLSQSPVDEILASTRDLVEVLELMSRTLNLPPRPSEHPLNYSLAQITSVFPARRKSVDLMLATSQEGLAGLSEPTSESRCADVTVLLLVLNCYTHALRLYVILFFHIYDFLNELAESEDPTLCAIPGLAFGSFPLSSGNLQATVFTQVSTSLFEKLESLIGLPQEYRISQRISQHRNSHGALFSEEDVMSIAKLVASQDEIEKPENGRGGVKLLRKHIKGITKLLRENIPP